MPRTLHYWSSDRRMTKPWNSNSMRRSEKQSNAYRENWPPSRYWGSQQHLDNRRPRRVYGPTWVYLASDTKIWSVKANFLYVNIDVKSVAKLWHEAHNMPGGCVVGANTAFLSRANPFSCAEVSLSIAMDHEFKKMHCLLCEMATKFA